MTCVLWTLVAYHQRAVCRLVEGDEGLALTVEYGGDIILAEMVGDLDAAV